MKILTPSKKIIHPRNVFATLDDLKRRREIKDEDVSIRVTIDACVRDGKGKLVGYEKFPCKSFNANWMKILRYLMADCLGNVVNSMDGETYIAGIVADNDLNVTKTSNPTLGPVIGTGTTTHAVTDHNLEKQITNGSVAPVASALTGTTHASFSNQYRIYDNGGNPLSNDEYNQYFIELTSGALSGKERIIEDTVDGSPDYFNLYSTGDGYGGFANDTDVDGVAYKIKSYGMMVHGTVGFTAPEDDGDLVSTITLTRTFANGCGETIDVTEFGLKVCASYYGSYSIRPLVIRDVKETPVSIANGQELTLTYTFACEA